MPEQQQQQQNNQNQKPDAAATAAAAAAAAAAKNGGGDKQQQKQSDTWASKTFTKPELKSHAILARFNNADALAESYVQLDKKFNDKNAHVRPGADASPEDKAEFNKWLGVPEGADKYSLNSIDKVKELLPEGTPINEGFVKAAFDACHSLGMTDEQASGVVQMFAAQQTAEMTAMSEKISKGIEDLKKELGHAYEPKLAVAGKAIDQLTDGENAIPGLKELMDPESNDPVALWVQSNPAMIRLFMFLGEAMGEDELVESEQRTEAATLDLKGKIAELRKPGSPFWDGNHADHKKYVEDVHRLTTELVGGASA